MSSAVASLCQSSSTTTHPGLDTHQKYYRLHPKHFESSSQQSAAVVLSDILTSGMNDDYSDTPSASQESKRFRDRQHKWGNGQRDTNTGCYKSRPFKQLTKLPKDHSNLNKARSVPSGSEGIERRLRKHLSDKETLADAAKNPISVADVPISHAHVRKNADSSVTITVTPMSTSTTRTMSVPLGALVAEKATEKLVRDEFVVVDNRGESTSKRKALQLLRLEEERKDKGAIEVDGFELL